MTDVAYKADRVRAAILKRGMTLKEVAVRAGMEAPAMSRILNEEPDLHISTLQRIADAVPCSPAEFFDDYKPHSGKSEVIVAFPRTQAERDKLAGTERAENFVAVPLLAAAASLGPGLNIEDADVEEYCLISRSQVGKGRHYAIKVKGDSMAPTLSDGDIVGVDVNDVSLKSLRGHLVAAKIGEGVTIKRFQIRDGDRPWYFQADNVEWERANQQLTSKAKDGLILGKVVWAWKKLG